MELVRTFHAVGQGAFYTERFYENNKNFYNVVYDCGTSNAQSNLINKIHDEFTQGSIINHLFISHFHNDHISGIMELRSYCFIKNYVIPVISPQLLAESALYNYFWLKDRGYGDASFNKLIDVTRMVVLESETIQISEQQTIPTHIDDNSNNKWVYIPYNPTQNPITDIIEELRNHDLENLAEAFVNMDFDKVKNEIKKADLNDLKQSYNAAFGGHHSYVMPVYSGYENPIVKTDKRVCLYTGDYDAGDSLKVEALIQPIVRKWDAVGTFQVPHHGSRNNSCQDLYLNKDRNYVISSYGSSGYHHPHGETIEYIIGQEDNAHLWLVGKERCAKFSYSI